MVCQGILTPDGLPVHVCGPFEGRVDDWSILLQSELQSKLSTHSFNDEGSCVCVYIYGDGGYTLEQGLVTFYRATRGGKLSVEEIHNANMARNRIAVEWGCMCVILYFYTATCGPKGHGSGGFFQKDLFLSPIEMINPSGATLSPSSHDPPDKGKER